MEQHGKFVPEISYYITGELFYSHGYTHAYITQVGFWLYRSKQLTMYRERRKDNKSWCGRHLSIQKRSRGTRSLLDIQRSNPAPLVCTRWGGACASWRAHVDRHAHTHKQINVMINSIIQPQQREIEASLLIWKTKRVQGLRRWLCSESGLWVGVPGSSTMAMLRVSSVGGGACTEKKNIRWTMHTRNHNPRMHRIEEGGVKQTQANQDSEQGQTTKACIYMDVCTYIYRQQHVNIHTYMHANICMYAYRYA